MKKLSNKELRKVRGGEDVIGYQSVESRPDGTAINHCLLEELALVPTDAIISGECRPEPVFCTLATGCH